MADLSRRVAGAAACVAFLHKYGRDWDESAAYACYAINTHAIAGTNVSPYELVFGRKPEDPNSVAVQDDELWGKKADKRYLSPAEFSRLRRGRMSEVKEQVMMESMEASSYDSRRGVHTGP